LSGGSIVSGGTGVTSFNPTINTTTTYYAQSRHLTTGCTSATRTAVTSTMRPDCYDVHIFAYYNRQSGCLISVGWELCYAGSVSGIYVSRDVGNSATSYACSDEVPFTPCKPDYEMQMRIDGRARIFRVYINEAKSGMQTWAGYWSEIENGTKIYLN
jgi:hypothetical protein